MSIDLDSSLRTLAVRDLPLSDPLIFEKTSSIKEVFRAMTERKRSGVLICHGRRLVGIFTERDLLNRLTAGDVHVESPVETVMTTAPKCVRPTDPLGQAIRLMTAGGYRHVPITEGAGSSLGLLTARRVLLFIAEHYPAEVLNLPPRLHHDATRREGG